MTPNTSLFNILLLKTLTRAPTDHTLQYIHTHWSANSMRTGIWCKSVQWILNTPSPTLPNKSVSFFFSFFFSHFKAIESTWTVQPDFLGLIPSSTIHLLCNHHKLFKLFGSQFTYQSTYLLELSSKRIN